MTSRKFAPALVAALVVGGTALTALAQTPPAETPAAPATPEAAAPTAPPTAPSAVLRGPGAMFFDQADADKDGRVTAEEFQAFRAGRTEGLDANGDGLISKEELVAHYTRMAQAMITAQVDRQMARSDLDGDGQLSAAELLVGNRGGSVAAGMFERADRNGDGVVTREEVATMGRASGKRGDDRREWMRGDRDGRGDWRRGDRDGRDRGGWHSQRRGDRD